MNRETNSYSTLGGMCSRSGYEEGRANVGRFNCPHSVEIDMRGHGRLLVTDVFNNALRSVDIATGEIGTVANSGFDSPRGLAWNGCHLLVANNNYISQVSWSIDGSVTNTIITGSHSSNHVDGSFIQAMFSHPEEFAKLESGVYLVVDYHSKMVRLVDFNEQVVGPVCFNGENPCNISSQLPNHPVSVTKIGNEVYVGMIRDMYRLTGM